MNDAIVSVRSGPLQPDEVAFIAAHPGMSPEQMQGALYDRLNILRTAMDLVPGVQEKKPTRVEKPSVPGKYFKNWPEEAIDLCLAREFPQRQILDELRKKFGITATVRSIRSVQHKFRDGSHPHAAPAARGWTPGELRFMWDNANLSRKEIVAQFHKKFPGQRSDPGILTQQRDTQYLRTAQDTGVVAYPGWTRPMIQFVWVDPEMSESAMTKAVREKFGVPVSKHSVNSIRSQIAIVKSSSRHTEIVNLTGMYYDRFDKAFAALPDQPNPENILAMLRDAFPTLGANCTALENRLLCYAVTELLEALRTADHFTVENILEG